MNTPIERLYRGAAAAGGPLLLSSSQGKRGVALGESVVVRVEGQANQARPGDRGRAGGPPWCRCSTKRWASPQNRAAIALHPPPRYYVLRHKLLGPRFDGHGPPVDGLPAPVAERVSTIYGTAINPCPPRPTALVSPDRRAKHHDNVSTLVRGQKLPVFSGPGLPGLELAARIVEWARAPRGEPFAVVFAAVGITARESREFVERIEQSGAMPRTVLYLNEASHPAVERLLAPRLALTCAEFLAFERGVHVLVVIADMTHYCEALREIATAREEIPGRRGYPGYMYTDLASIYERAGIIPPEREGSITQIPILTMPDDDMTHPIPDLTGYITEGQILLSREMHRQRDRPAPSTCCPRSRA